MEKYGNSSKKEMEVDDEGSIMEKEDEDDNNGVGRTYECNYCKRGFTNAQALGGHMNIHRKDKAKAKHRQQHPTFSTSPSSSSSSSFIPQMRNYQYYPFPTNPTMPTTRFESQPPLIYEENRRTRLFDHLGAADLSLRISSSNIADHYHHQQKSNINKQNHHYDDIDLELRLGYHP